MNAKIYLLALTFLGSSSLAYSQENYFKALEVAIQKMKAGEYDAAQAALETGQKEAVSDVQRTTISLMSANLYLSQGKNELARKSFQAIADNEKVAPQSRLEAFSGIGLTYAVDKKPEEERTAYKKALKIADQDVLLFYNIEAKIADSFSREKKFDLARQELAKVLVREDIDLYTLSSTHFDIGTTFLDEGDTKRARESFAKVLEVKEGLAPQEFQEGIVDNKQEALIAIANSYFLDKDYAQAKTEISKTLEMKDLSRENRAEAEALLKKIDAKLGGTVPAAAGPN